jgi:hypothetical protein
VMVMTTRVKRAPIVKLARRRLISLDETTLVRTLAFDVKNYKLVYLRAVTPHLNSCLINCNLRRSYKVGMCRMWYLCEFIVRIWYLVVKLSDCTKKLILDASFLIFGLSVVSIFRWVVFNLAGSSFNETVMLLPAKLWAHCLSWRRSPLAL